MQTCQPLGVSSMLQPRDHMICIGFSDLFKHTEIELYDGVACCDTAMVIGLSIVACGGLMTTLLVSS